MIGRDEISANFGKLKGGKSPGVDERDYGYLKSVVEWLVRLFNGRFREE